MDVVYARTSCVVSWEGGTTVLAEGQVWDAAAELVRARPDLFSAEPTKVHGRPAGTRPVVEDAAQAPGQRRRGRPRKG